MDIWMSHSLLKRFCLEGRTTTVEKAVLLFSQLSKEEGCLMVFPSTN
jgi:hypothetical protein